MNAPRRRAKQRSTNLDGYQPGNGLTRNPGEVQTTAFRNDGWSISLLVPPPSLTLQMGQLLERAAVTVGCPETVARLPALPKMVQMLEALVERGVDHRKF